MRVGCVHAAGTQESNSHGHAVADEGGHIRGGGCNGVTSGAVRLARSLVQEVEYELPRVKGQLGTQFNRVTGTYILIVEHFEAVIAARSSTQFRDELCGTLGEDTRGESQ